jgi:hypothetical protein
MAQEQKNLRRWLHCSEPAVASVAAREVGWGPPVLCLLQLQRWRLAGPSCTKKEEKMSALCLDFNGLSQKLPTSKISA